MSLTYESPLAPELVGRLPEPERTTTTRLRYALSTGKTVNFVYDGKIRIVEVHAIGTSTKDGSIVMRGYQVAGHASRPLPIWSLYTVDKIELLDFGTEPSRAPRPGYKRGDKQMREVLVELLV